MNKKMAQRLVSKIQDAGDNTARAVCRSSGEWHVSTTSTGIVRSPFDWYFIEAKLGSTLRRLKRLKHRL
jgi:hypothetical protein